MTDKIIKRRVETKHIVNIEPANPEQQQRNCKFNIFIVLLFYLDDHALAVNTARLRVAERQLAEVNRNIQNVVNERDRLKFQIRWFKDIEKDLKSH